MYVLKTTKIGSLESFNSKTILGKIRFRILLEPIMSQGDVKCGTSYLDMDTQVELTVKTFCFDMFTIYNLFSVDRITRALIWFPHSMISLWVLTIAHGCP